MPLRVYLDGNADRTMTVIGDSMSPRSGMDDYLLTAEVIAILTCGPWVTMRRCATGVPGRACSMEHRKF